MTFIADRPERLDKFLARMMPEHSRVRLQGLIEQGRVKVEGRARKPSFPLEPGTEVAVSGEPAPSPAHNLEPADIPLDVRFEDEHLLVVNKPRGLATHPAASLREPSLVNALLGRSGALSSGSAAYRPGIVHRLDKDTTGLIVVAKTDSAHLRLARQIGGKSAERRYVAVVSGEPDRERFVVTAPLARDPHNRLRMAVDAAGKPAVTHVKRLGRLDEGALVAVRLETGRTHQIRAHLQAVRHPVVGDRIYNPRPSELPLQLHAAYLAFDHPGSGERLAIFQEPPEDFVGRGHPSLEAAASEPF